MKKNIKIVSFAIIISLFFYAKNTFSREFKGNYIGEVENMFKKNIFFKNKPSRPGPYNIAFGICGSMNSGITFKKFLGEEKAFEIILSSRWRGISATGFYEICVGATERGTGLIWNFGLGPRLGFYEGKYYKDYLGLSRDDRAYSVIGLAGTFGFEYYFLKIPFTIGFDYRPFFDLKGADDSILDGAVSLRYVF